MRYFLEIAYKGTAYHGWQKQPNAITVQEVIEKALFTLLREPIETLGSGRTDTGVHATVQIAHFDVPAPLPASFLLSLNAILPDSISVQSVVPVHDRAHARFDAVHRSYVYKIALQKNPFDKGLVWMFKGQPDVALMNQAAAYLLEYTDYECFSKVHTDVANFHCTIHHAYWEQHGTYLFFHITANRFLRGMVRAIVGTLVDVGRHKLTIDEWLAIIASKKRTKAGMSAPPEGLYLSEVAYPDSIYIKWNTE